MAVRPGPCTEGMSSCWRASTCTACGQSLENSGDHKHQSHDLKSTAMLDRACHPIGWLQNPKAASLWRTLPSGKGNWRRPQKHFKDCVNPLSPDINMHILLIVLHTFHIIPLGRICSKIKTFHPCWSFYSFSLPVCFISEWYCEEKLDSGHYWGLHVKC